MTLDTLQNGDPITPEWIDQLILKLTECADLAAIHAQLILQLAQNLANVRAELLDAISEETQVRAAAFQATNAALQQEVTDRETAISQLGDSIATKHLAVSENADIELATVKTLCLATPSPGASTSSSSATAYFNEVTSGVYLPFIRLSNYNDNGSPAGVLAFTIDVVRPNGAILAIRNVGDYAINVVGTGKSVQPGTIGLFLRDDPTWAPVS